MLSLPKDPGLSALFAQRPRPECSHYQALVPSLAKDPDPCAFLPNDPDLSALIARRPKPECLFCPKTLSLVLSLPKDPELSALFAQ